MNTKKTSKIITYTIYTLILTLSLLILYNFYLIYKNISSPNVPPKNSVKVSPLTGEEITNVSSKDTIVKVTYNSNISEYGNLSNASIIFEDNKNGTKLVSALFMEYDLIKDSSMDIISENYSNILPNIKFISKEQLTNLYRGNVNTINITRPNSSSSYFLFFDNSYHHFTSDKEDTDSLNGEAVPYSNIVIDISLIKPNTLLIFSGGKAYKSTTNSELYLLQGKTYWLTLNNTDLILPSYDKIQEGLK